MVQVEQQPDLNDTDDLLRYREGELLSFLLKLSPEQEKYVNWSLNTSGPTLVKGGPGTGKSTIRCYPACRTRPDIRKDLSVTSV
jgi:MoxR-like ATPase